MNVFLLGLRVTDSALVEDGKVNVIAESLPSSNKKISTKVQLIQKEDHYVGKLLKDLDEKQEVLAIGPTKATPDGVIQMQPMLVVTPENFSDILAINTSWRAVDLVQSQKRARSVTHCHKPINCLASSRRQRNKLVQAHSLEPALKQLSELPNGTPTIAVGRVSTSEKGEKQYLNYAVDQILYLPKGTKSAPKKAADPEKGQVAAAAIGSINFSL